MGFFIVLLVLGLLLLAVYLFMFFMCTLASEGAGRTIHTYKMLKKSDPSTWNISQSGTKFRMFDGSSLEFMGEVAITLDKETKVRFVGGLVSPTLIRKPYRAVDIEHPFESDYRISREFDSLFHLKGILGRMMMRYVEKRICDVVAAKEL